VTAEILTAMLCKSEAFCLKRILLHYRLKDKTIATLLKHLQPRFVAPCRPTLVTSR